MTDQNDNYVLVMEGLKDVPAGYYPYGSKIELSALY